MPERADFWKGFFAGTLAGMMVAAFSQFDLWRALTTPNAARTSGVVEPPRPVIPGPRLEPHLSSRTGTNR